jgi:hypothetical protein
MCLELRRVIRSELEVNDLPGNHVAGGSDEGDQRTNGQRPAKADRSTGDIVAIRADAEESQQEGEDHGRVADDQARS